MPVVHEVSTSFGSLGDVITGNPGAARGRWKRYAEESVVGSGVYAAVEASKGNRDRATELGKGMGRATGKMLLGGGILRDVPVLHELATCGESLGDMIGGGDQNSARGRWDAYAAESVVGSSIYAAVEARKGRGEHAQELRRGSAKAGKKAGITAAAVTATVGVTVATAGAGLPAAIALGAATGATAGAAATAGVQAVDGKVNPGDVVGNALLGGTAGAIAGGLASRVAVRAVAADADAIALSEAVATRPLLVSSAVGASSLGRSVLDEMLQEARARVYEHRMATNTPAADIEVAPDDPLEHLSGQKTQEACFEPCMDLECSICLETELEYPGIRRVQHCSASSSCSEDNSGCCQHAFHRECIIEWRRVCEARGEEFTCPECRRILPCDIDWEVL